MWEDIAARINGIGWGGMASVVLRTYSEFRGLTAKNPRGSEYLNPRRDDYTAALVAHEAVG
jgi:hypothetical protein